MTVAFDAELDLGSFTTTTPDDTTFTPAGTPRAVLVGIAHDTVSTDLITSVSYGGVAMARVDSGVTTGGAEPGRAYLYFLGASIPTGAQTVSIVHSGSATVKWAAAWSCTAAADTEVGASGNLGAVQTNPQIALNTTPTSLRFSILYSGVGAPSDGNLAALTNVLATSTSPRVDFGNNVAVAGRQTSAASSGSFTIGYTAGSDDVAMVAAAVQEVTGGGNPHTRTIQTVILSDLVDS